MKAKDKLSIVRVPIWGYIVGISGIAAAITGIVLLERRTNAIEATVEKIKSKIKKAE